MPFIFVSANATDCVQKKDAEQSPWQDSSYRIQFLYLEETYGEQFDQNYWDALEPEKQSEMLNSACQPAMERFEEVKSETIDLMSKWNPAEAKQYYQNRSDFPEKIEAAERWLGPGTASRLEENLSLKIRALEHYISGKLTEEDVNIARQVFDALLSKSIKESMLAQKEMSNQTPDKTPKKMPAADGKMGENFQEMNKIGGQGPDVYNSQGKFYDGSKPDNSLDPTGTLSPASDVKKDGHVPLLAGERGSVATTVEHSAPDKLTGEDDINILKSESSENTTVVKSGKGRLLTDDEIKAAKEIYGDKIDYKKVRVITGDDMTLWGKILTSGGAAVTWGNTIYFPNNEDKSVYDFSKKPDWFVHEMGHVYQYQKDGWSYALKSAWDQITKGERAYQYELVPDKPFNEYGIEQQATILQDYFRFLKGYRYRAREYRTFTPEEAEIMEKMLRDEGLLKQEL